MAKLQADIIPWIYIHVDSPALYIVRTVNSMPPVDMKFGSFTTLLNSLKLFTIEVESHFQTHDDPSLVCD